jgi:uncharacterized protein (DUF302 family)
VGAESGLADSGGVEAAEFFSGLNQTAHENDGFGGSMEIRYAVVREFPELGYDEAVDRVTKALQSEGFGVLTEIDVKATLKKKINADFRRYVILGACNPQLAHKALSGEPMIGVLLPCNVVVMDREGGGSIVAAFKPTAAFALVDNPEVSPIAEAVEERLRRVLDSVE